MNILRRDAQATVMIDPQEDYDEREKYVGASKPPKVLIEVVEWGCQLQYAFRSLQTLNGENLLVQVIFKKISPGHAEPFRTHRLLHRFIIILRGTITAVESETLTEGDRDKIQQQGTVLEEGDMVIEDWGVRHTVANFGSEDSLICTIQAVHLPLGESKRD